MCYMAVVQQRTIRYVAVVHQHIKLRGNFPAAYYTLRDSCPTAYYMVRGIVQQLLYGTW